MVLHKAVGYYPHAVFWKGITQYSKVLQPVLIAEEDLLAMITPVDYMVWKLWYYYSRSSSHTTH